MSIVAENATKSFGDFIALDDVSIERPGRLADRAARPVRQRQVDAPAGDRGTRAARLRAASGSRRPGRDRAVPVQERDIGFVFQHYAAFKHMTVRDNVAFGLRSARRPQGQDPRSGSRS